MLKSCMPRGPPLKPTSSITLFGGLAKANPYPGSTMVSIVNGGMLEHRTV
jgi:hypothetical protein